MSHRGRGVLLDLTGPDALLHLEEGERLYRLYFFRPAWGRSLQFEHRVLAKQRTDGKLSIISYTISVSSEGKIERSNILRVPEIPPETLEQIIDAILIQTNTSPEEFEEVDLTPFDTLEEQMERLKDYGLLDE
ncbi:MAG: hypothetical protein J7M34_01885 [Anaerolineae bacterium]|nr:hypothetical protein [Anaerolineae bacterium]